MSVGKENTAAFYSREDTCCFNLSTLLIFIDLPLETFALGTTWIHITLILFVCFSGNEQVWRTHSSHVWLASSNMIRLQAETNLQSESYLQMLMIQIASIWHFPIKKLIFLILACISLLFTLLELLMPHTWVHQSLIKTLSKTSTLFSQDSHSHELPNVTLTLCCPEVHLISDIRTCNILGKCNIWIINTKNSNSQHACMWKIFCRTVHRKGKTANRTSGGLLWELKDGVRKWWKKNWSSCLLQQILNSPHHTHTWEMFHEIFTEAFSQGHGLNVNLPVPAGSPREMVRDYSFQHIGRSLTSLMYKWL